MGNIWGSWPGSDALLKGSVVTGSHCDAIPKSGMYDGTLGVVGAIAALKALRDSVCSSVFVFSFIYSCFWGYFDPVNFNFVNVCMYKFLGGDLTSASCFTWGSYVPSCCASLYSRLFGKTDSKTSIRMDTHPHAVLNCIYDFLGNPVA